MLNVALSTPAIAVAPTVLTGGVEFPYSSVIVSMSGTVNPNGIATSDYNVYFQYGLSTNYGYTTQRNGGDSTFNGVEALSIADLAVGLKRGTTYHYRLVAGNSEGFSYGADATFTTPLNMTPTAQDIVVNAIGVGAVSIYTNVQDRDGDALTLTVSSPSHGTATSDTAQYIIYKPDTTKALTDDFTFTVSDGFGGTATANVHWANVSNTIVGKYVSTVFVGGIPGDDKPAGSIGLNITTSMTYSGVASFFGARYSIHGLFSVDGRAVEEINRIGAPPITIELTLDPSSGVSNLTGVIHASEIDYGIKSSTRLIFPENPAEAGSYTMALPPSDASLPLGNGYVTGKVSKHGRVIFTGRIGDGQPFSFGTQLRQGGSAEIYVTAGSKPRDRIYGTLQFPGLGANESTGELYWYKAPRSTSYYQEGFQPIVFVQGSRLLLTAEEDKILDYSTELAGWTSFSRISTTMNCSLARWVEKMRRRSLSPSQQPSAPSAAHCAQSQP